MARKGDGSGTKAARKTGSISGNGLGRRQYVKTGTIAAAAAATVTGASVVKGLSGASVASDGVEFRGFHFNRVLNAVDDLGLDPTGNEVINENLYSQTGPGDLVIFPDGRYLCSDRGRYEATEGAPIGWVAEAAFHSGDPAYDYEADVTFVADHGTNGYCPDTMGGARLDFLFEGIDYDFSLNDDDRSGQCILGLRFHLAGRWEIRNCDTTGRAINYDNPGLEEQMVGGTVLDPNATALIQHCDWREQHDWALYTTLDGNGAGGRMGVWTGATHVGHIVMDDVKISEFGNNAFYMSTTDLEHEGSVELRNSYVANCGAAGARLPMSPNSKIVDTLFEYDESLYTGPDYTDQQANSVANRPIVVETTGQDGYHDDGPFVIRGCHFRIRDTPRPAPVIHAYPGGRWIVVEDCTFDLKNYDQVTSSPHSGRTACLVQMSEARPHWGGQPIRSDPAQLEMRNCRAVIENVGGAGDSVISILDRDGSVIENCCIEAIDSPHDGVTVERWARNYSPFQVLIENSRINVAGETVVNIGNNDVVVSDVKEGGSCSVEDVGDPEATHSADFRTSPGGAGPPGWTPRWMSTAADWMIDSDDGILTFDATSRGRRALAWEDVGIVRDVDVLALCRVPEIVEDGNHARIHVRSGGGSAFETGYFAEVRAEGITLARYLRGSGRKLDQGERLESNAWYWLRFRATGNRLQVRYWRSDTAEPDAWNLEATDDRITQGWVGVGAYDPHPCHWAGFAVGTGGLAAPGIELVQTASTAAFDPYTTSDGSVDTEGLLQAVEDWRSGTIETDHFEEILNAWRTGSTLS